LSETPIEPEILPPDPRPLAQEREGRVFDTEGNVEAVAPRRRAFPAAAGAGARLGCAGPLARWLGLALVALAGLGVLLLVFGPDGAAALAASLRQAGALGKVAVVLGVALSTPLMVPSGLLAVLPGYVWGPAWGTALVVLGAALGGALNMALVRTLIGPWVARRIAAAPALAALRQAFAARGFRVALALRLSPVAPYALIAYLAGLAGVRVGSFVAASILGGVPWTAVYASFGALLAARHQALVLQAPPDSPSLVALRVAGLVLTLAVAWWVGRLARATLKAAARGAGSGLER
jgi:uncharacterized membrane protein YdjX (TVP38/TMEM64 family)